MNEYSDNKQREQEFEEMVNGIYEATDDPLVQLFAIAIGTATKYAKELVVDKISREYIRLMNMKRTNM